MTGYVWRRSVAALSALGGVLILACWLLTVFTPVPVLVPVAVVTGLALLQYLVGPRVVEWLAPARELERGADGYLSDEPVAAIVARQCRNAGIPLVRLGIVEDGDPNAFTFGRTRRDARIWISRGLLDRLNDREVEAVVAHEIGHIRNRDFAVMTALCVVPTLMYYAASGTRNGDQSGDNDPVRLIGSAAYLLSELALLSFSRARELGADHASCALTGDGDALCSALVKIVHGMGERDQDLAARVHVLRENDEKRAARRLARRENRVRAVGALGIASSGSAPSVGLIALELPPERLVRALRWEVTSPWARWLEILSTHPLVSTRIAALEASGLPGAPRQWRGARSAARGSAGERVRARGQFLVELPVYFGGWICLGAALILARRGPDHYDLGFLAGLVTAAGALLLIRAGLRAPLGTPEPVGRLIELLDRLDAGPLGAIPVSLRGTIVGRGGFVTSPDLVLADASGTVPVVYRHPAPGGRILFALTRAQSFVGDEVVVTGWYLRAPHPYVELRTVTGAEAGTVRCWLFAARYLLSAAVLLAGALLFVYAP
ncbi:MULTISPECIES: zinc metalloprotease HtpX [unclassified Parafrankia]|uniref:zinc metalloprotease HtpX n=1 Tax=unclassified Parafrankia TaxID=2994368 RepID=UPI000DA5D5F0|nr:MULTISPECIES: zinc metalloprotease HtpX [unclassified Parafrankia]TCJ37631.1 protease [Parafrankia sp. BMG5.11]SQD99772.1 Peptidase M48 Ste24p [Parafrankia sp. Ea1.12]